MTLKETWKKRRLIDDSSRFLICRKVKGQKMYWHLNSRWHWPAGKTNDDMDCIAAGTVVYTWHQGLQTTTLCEAVSWLTCWQRSTERVWGGDTQITTLTDPNGMEVYRCVKTS